MKAISVCIVATMLAPAALLAQEWKAYPYPDAGFAVQFPVPPKVDSATFKSAAGVSLPMTRYSVRLNKILYRLDVVDFSSTSADASSTIADAEKSLGAAGKVTVAIDARVNRAMGRELSVNGNDGSRSTIAIFFVNKHLYLLDGQALPPNAIASSGDAIRFQESLQFIGQNGGFGGRGGPDGFGGPGRFRGGANPQALSACAGKAVGDAVQLQLPRGGATVAATCTLVARPNQQPNAVPGGPAADAPPPRPAP